MLVLSRKPSEAVTIGDDIKITILGVDSDRVKIGIEAPKSMRVFRYETIKKVVVENQVAAHVNVTPVELANLKETIQGEE